MYLKIKTKCRWW